MNKQAIDETLQRAVDAGDTFGVVATVADRSGPRYVGAFGERKARTGEPITPEVVFRIASMTKPITSVAALQLADRGELDLDAPVASIVPSWADLKVLEGFDRDTPKLREQRTTATVRHLLTHTAGLSYWIWNSDTTRYEEMTGQLNVLSGMNSCFENPLVRDAGQRWEYSMATDWVGRVVENVSGKALDQYFNDEILEPLGMNDTTVKLGDEGQQRRVPVHVRTPDGDLDATELSFNESPEFWAGGHCLYSTAGDYQRLQRMLLGNGEVEGVRLLSEDMVEQMFTNQIGDLTVEPLPEVHPELSAEVDFGQGLKFGLGVMLNPEPWPDRRGAGSGTWAGLFNSHFWVDRASGVTAAIFMQFLPFWDPRARAVYENFEKAVYRS